MTPTDHADHPTEERWSAHWRCGYCLHLLPEQVHIGKVWNGTEPAALGFCDEQCCEAYADWERRGADYMDEEGVPMPYRLWVRAGGDRGRDPDWERHRALFAEIQTLGAKGAAILEEHP